MLVWIGIFPVNASLLNLLCLRSIETFLLGMLSKFFCGEVSGQNPFFGGNWYGVKGDF